MASQAVRERIVGSVVLAVAAGFLVWAYIGSVPTPAAGYSLEAEFGHVEGITVGAEVRLGGVAVGRVIDVGLKAGRFRPLVTMAIRADILIPADSVALIRGDGLIGAKYVRIVPGSAAARLTPGAAFAATGDVIDLEAAIRRIVELAVE